MNSPPLDPLFSETLTNIFDQRSTNGNPRKLGKNIHFYGKFDIYPLVGHGVKA